jgi:hypothetical protein
MGASKALSSKSPRKQAPYQPSAARKNQMTASKEMSISPKFNAGLFKKSQRSLYRPMMK